MLICGVPWPAATRLKEVCSLNSFNTAKNKVKYVLHASAKTEADVNFLRVKPGVQDSHVSVPALDIPLHSFRYNLHSHLQLSLPRLVEPFQQIELFNTQIPPARSGKTERKRSEIYRHVSL